MKYKVKYERQVSSKYSYWDYSTEIIEARGIVHAHKLAKDHLREIKKLTPVPVRIAKILVIEENEADV